MFTPQHGRQTLAVSWRPLVSGPAPPSPIDSASLALDDHLRGRLLLAERRFGDDLVNWCVARER